MYFAAAKEQGINIKLMAIPLNARLPLKARLTPPHAGDWKQEGATDDPDTACS
jgi:hypothetical protein